MNNFLEVSLSNGKQKIKLHFKLLENDLVSRWTNKINSVNVSDYYIHTTWGMYSGMGEESHVVEKLNTYVTKFNSIHSPLYQIILIGNDDCDAEVAKKLNEMHDQFAKYYYELGCENVGPGGDPALVESAQLLRSINSSIHTAESIIKAKEYLKQGVLCAFFGGSVSRNEIEPDRFLASDYQYFTTAESFGDIFVHYNRVGKSLYDVYLSNDISLLQSGYKTRAIKDIGVGMLGLFSNYPKNHDEQISRFYEWWDKNNLDQYGYCKEKPENRIGFAKLGSLVSNQYIGHLYNPRSQKFDEFATVGFCSEYSTITDLKIVSTIADA